MNSAARTVVQTQSDMEEGISGYTFFSSGFKFINIEVMKAVPICSLVGVFFFILYYDVCV